MNLKEVRLRQRVSIWLLAQLGFWAKKWVGPRRARAAMKKWQFFYPDIGVNLLVGGKQMRTRDFVDFCKISEAQGLNDAEIASELGIRTTELRALRHSLRSQKQ